MQNGSSTRFPYTQQHSVWNCYLSINGFAVFSKDFAPVESLGVGTGGGLGVGLMLMGGVERWEITKQSSSSVLHMYICDKSG